jgi:hypothetical protein
MITAPLLSMFVIPVVYLLIRRPRSRREYAASHAIGPDTTYDAGGGKVA